MKKTNNWMRSALALVLSVCLVLGTPVSALAASADQCPAVATAVVKEAVEFCGLAREIVDLIVSLAIEGQYASYFKGSQSKGTYVETVALNAIWEELDKAEYEALIVKLGFNTDDDTKEALAIEIFDVACLYYDTINIDKKSATEASRLCVIELVRYTLAETKGKSATEATQSAEIYYELDEINTSSGNSAAVEHAMKAYGGKHSYDNGSITKEATCIATGEKTYTCSACNDTKIETIPTVDHSFGEPAWNWSDDCSKATATFKCTACNESETTVNAAVTQSTSDGDCETGGTITYAAKVALNGKTYTDERTKMLDASGHSYGDAVWTWASDNSAAKVSRICTKCQKTIESNATIDVDETKATCTVDGSATYTATATLDGVQYSDVKNVKLEATDHNYGEPTWSWAADYTKASAVFKCATCGESVTKDATVTKEIKNATCTTDGSTVYKASVKVDNKEYTDSKTTVIAANGTHTYGDAVWTWGSNNTSASVSRTCSGCGNVDSAKAIVTKTTVDATCTANGAITYTAVATLEGVEYKDTKTENIQAINHTYGEVTWTWNDDYSSATAAVECSACGDTVSAKSSRVTKKTVEATCFSNGATTYTATVTLNGTRYSGEKIVEIPATGEHSYEATWTWSADYLSAKASLTCTACETAMQKNATVKSALKEATCTADGTTTYTATVELEYTTYSDTKTVTIPAIGHDYGTPSWTWADNYESASVSLTCAECRTSNKAAATITYTKADGSCVEDGQITYVATVQVDGVTYEDTRSEVVPGEHKYVNGTCTVCGSSEVERVFGEDRGGTAIAVADLLKETMGVEKFDVIILASGDEFADALAGSYLATQKNAPILLHREANRNDNLNYIQNNLADNGVLYILGGNVAVPEYIEKELQNDGIKCVRLSGTTRYETNIAILKEAGIKAGQEILIATGNEFADSLSASATGLPILLVSNALTELQMEYLQSVSGSKLTIIGGTNAVSAELEEVLSQYGTVSRISGADRYATSVAVAECYFEEPEAILLAYGRNFPDGLCGGPLGYIMGAPLLLVQDGNEKNAADYVAKYDVVSGIVLGGTAVVSDKTVAAVF